MTEAAQNLGRVETIRGRRVQVVTVDRVDHVTELPMQGSAAERYAALGAVVETARTCANDGALAVKQAHEIKRPFVERGRHMSAAMGW